MNLFDDLTQINTDLSTPVSGQLYSAARTVSARPQIWSVVLRRHSRRRDDLLFAAQAAGGDQRGHPQGNSQRVENQGGCREAARGGQGPEKPLGSLVPCQKCKYQIGRAAGRTAGARVANYSHPGSSACRATVHPHAPQWPTR